MGLMKRHARVAHGGGFGGVLAKIAATAVVAALAIRSRKASA